MKLAASKNILAFSKLRAGRRPVSVETLLRKEKDGAIFKTSSFGDTEPLWQDRNVGKVDYESKVPVKLNPRVMAPDSRSGDTPTANVSGIGVRAEDGRSNATTFTLGTTATGDIVPDALPSSYKLSSACWKAFCGELSKLSALTDSEASEALERLDALEKSKMTPEQVARYSAIGAFAGPAVGLGRSLIQGKGLKGYFREASGLKGHARHILGDVAAGAATSGAIPILRSALDRQAAKAKLQQWVSENPLGVTQAPGPMDAELPSAKLGSLLSRLPTAGVEHATDLAGLGLMAAGSGSHLYGQLKGQEDTGSPISPAAQSGMDLAGLGMMAAPTIAALSSLKKRAPIGAALAGGGSKWVNRLNLAGLGALALPTADKIQAHLRSAKGEDPEHKELLGEKAHRALELAGYGTLAAPVVHSLAKGQGGLGELGQLAGYATLAAPHVVPFSGAARTGSELAGLGLLAAPAAAHALGGHHA